MKIRGGFNKLTGILLLTVFSLATPLYDFNILEQLFSEGFYEHASLLKDAVNFEEEYVREYENNLAELYVQNANYFLQKIRADYGKIPQELAPGIHYLYLKALYQEKDYVSFLDAEKTIKYASLSSLKYSNCKIMLANSYYQLNLTKELYLLAESISQDVLLVSEAKDKIQALIDFKKQQTGQSLKLSETNIESFYLKAWQDLNIKSYDQAEENFRKVIKQTNESNLKDYSYFGAGLANIGKGDFKKARIDFLAIKGDYFYKDRDFWLIYLDFSESKLQDMVLKIEGYKQKYPKESKYQAYLDFYLGYMHFDKGAYNEAINYFAKASFLNESKIYFLLAESEYKVSAYSNAGENYYKTIQLINSKDELYLPAWYGRAWSLFKQAKYKDAIDGFNIVIANASSQKDLLVNAKLKKADAFFNRGSYADSQDLYNEILSSIDEVKDQNLYKQVLFNYANILAKLKKFREANEMLAKYLEKGVAEKEAYQIKKLSAVNYFKAGQYQNASKIYEELILLYKDTQDEEVYISLANSYFNLEQFEKAVTVYQDFLKVFPVGDRILDARYGLVQSLFMLKNDQEVLIEAKKTDEAFNTNLFKEYSQKIEFRKGSGI